jgi:hypothetical protein
MGTYEPCVIGSDGRCTRWSHDHGEAMTDLKCTCIVGICSEAGECCESPDCEGDR